MNEGTRRCDQFHSHSPLTTTLEHIAVFHLQLIGEDTGQVQRSRALHVVCCMRRSKSHSYEVSLCEGEGAGQMNTLGAEGFDLVLCAYSDLVDAVPTDLIVLHVADF